MLIFNIVWFVALVVRVRWDLFLNWFNALLLTHIGELILNVSSAVGLADRVLDRLVLNDSSSFLLYLEHIFAASCIFQNSSIFLTNLNILLLIPAWWWDTRLSHGVNRWHWTILTLNAIFHIVVGKHWSSLTLDEIATHGPLVWIYHRGESNHVIFGISF